MFYQNRSCFFTFLYARVFDLKIIHLVNYFCDKIGKSVFYFVEPFFKLTENRDPEVKRHFSQALLNIKKSKQTIALLNLNMVIGLKPNHFLARVHRGRIYAGEGHYRLASEDYLEANRINHYRFIHYDLYREYFKSVNNEFDTKNDSTLKNFNEVSNSSLLASNCQYRELDSGREPQEQLSLIESDKKASLQDFYLTAEEKEKFQTLGPISQKELEETDWDSFMDELYS